MAAHHECYDRISRDERPLERELMLMGRRHLLDRRSQSRIPDAGVSTSPAHRAAAVAVGLFAQVAAVITLLVCRSLAVGSTSTSAGGFPDLALKIGSLEVEQGVALLAACL